MSTKQAVHLADMDQPSDQGWAVDTKEENDFVDKKMRALLACQDRMFKIFCNLAFRIQGPPLDEFIEYSDLRDRSYALISQMDA
jgi:hypothetical protein